MQESNTRPISVADEVKNSFLDYSMSVIISRALPDVRDGLKPSQRRILYAMHELGLYPPKKQMKCAKICGDTSGNYHPHGEAVIYPTLVHMGQPWAMRETLRHDNIYVMQELISMDTSTKLQMIRISSKRWVVLN